METPSQLALPANSLLLVWESVDSVLSTIGSSRIKYSCIEATASYLVFGANTGSLYFFDRTADTPKFLQILSLPEVREPITHLRFDESETHLAFSTSRTGVFVVELNLRQRKEKEKIIAKITEHKDSPVTCLAWGGSGDDLTLFSGDEAGFVYGTNISKCKSILYGYKGVDLLQKAGSPIVQIDTMGGQLCIATKQLCLLLDIDFSRQEVTVRKVGKKPERDGRYGACFHSVLSALTSTRLLFSARPGARLWKVDSSKAAVLNTMNFSQFLTTPTLFVTRDVPSDESASPAAVQQPAKWQWQNLAAFGEQCLLAWDANFLLLLDVAHGQLIEWHTDLPQIADLAIYGNYIYVLHGSSRTHVSRLVGLPPTAFVSRVIATHITGATAPPSVAMIQRCLDVVTAYAVTDPAPLRSLSDLIDKLSPEQLAMLDKAAMAKLEAQLAQAAVSVPAEVPPAAVVMETPEGPLPSATPLVVDVPSVFASSLPLSESPARTPSPPVESATPPISVNDSATVFPTAPTSTPAVAIETDRNPNGGSPIAGSPSAPTASLTAPSAPVVTAEPLAANPVAAAPEPAGTAPVVAKSKGTKKRKRIVEIGPAPQPAVVKGPTTTAPQAAPKTPAQPTPPVTAAPAAPQPVAPVSPLPTTATLTSAANTTSPQPLTIAEQTAPTNPVTVPPRPESPAPAVTDSQSGPTSTPSVQSAASDASSNSSPSITKLSKVPSSSKVSMQKLITSSVEIGKKMVKKVKTSAQAAQASMQANKGLGDIKTLIQNLQGSKPGEPTMLSGDKPAITESPTATGPSTDAPQAASGGLLTPPTNMTHTRRPSSEPVYNIDPLTRETHTMLATYGALATSVPLTSAVARWLSSFDPTNPPTNVPPSWITQFVTAAFEVRLWKFAAASDGVDKAESTPTQAADDDEDAAKYFIVRYYIHLDLARVYLLCNQWRFEGCIQLLFELEDQHPIPPGNESVAAALAATRGTLDKLLNEGNGAGVVDVLRGSANHPALVLRTLGRLFEISPKAAYQYAVQAYPIVQPWNVERHRRGPPQLFVDYLGALITPARPECAANSELVHRWFEANLELAPPPADRLFERPPQAAEMEATRPARGAHAVKWKRYEVLMKIIDSAGVFTYSNTRLLTLCRKHGFYHGQMQLLLKKRRLLEAVELTLWSDDVRGFCSLVDNHPLTADEWRSILNTFENVRFEDSIRAHDGAATPRNITNTLVANHMIGSLGASTSLQLLVSSVHFSSSVPPFVYYNILRAGRAEAELNDVVHDVLATLDHQLWAKKPPTIAPQFRAVKEVELAKRYNELPFVRETNRGKLEADFDYTLPLPRFYEEMAGHWGVETDFGAGNCACCTLPLLEKVGSNLVVFPCGHAFHQLCVVDEACPTCIASAAEAHYSLLSYVAS